MAPYDDDDGPYTPSGDLEDESNLNEILMEEYDTDEVEDPDLENAEEDVDDVDFEVKDGLDDIDDSEADGNDTEDIEELDEEELDEFN